MADEATCKGCGRPVVWIRTAAGKAMICDPSVVSVVTDDGKVARGRIPHWATCPKADQFRRREP